jgi:hypothetical protein
MLLLNHLKNDFGKEYGTPSIEPFLCKIYYYLVPSAFMRTYSLVLAPNFKTSPFLS